MKKYFLFLALIGFLFTACKEWLGNKENGDKPIMPSTSILPTMPTEILYTATYPLQFTRDGGYKEVFGANIVSHTSIINGQRAITFDAPVMSIGTRAFYDCHSLTSITIPDSVTEIGSKAFYRCWSLTNITIPGSVTKIGDGAFCGCGRLTSISIPNSVTEIGCEAFSSCASLTSVTIPDSVTSIGNGAFEWCENLTSVYCKSTIPPVVGVKLFYNNAYGRKIYVPRNSLIAYKTAEGWSDYAWYIEGYDF